MVPIDLAHGYEFKVYAHWTRRPDDCAESGQRVSQIKVFVPIGAGETRVIEGAGGLVVTVTRRT